MKKRKCVYEAVMDLKEADFSGDAERFQIINEEYPDGISLDYIQMQAMAICKKGSPCEPASSRCKMLKGWAEQAGTWYYADEAGNVIMSSLDEKNHERIESVVYKRQ